MNQLLSSILILYLLIPNTLTANNLLNYPNALDREELLKIKTLMENSDYSQSEKKVSILPLKSNSHTYIKDTLLSLIPNCTIIPSNKKNSLIVVHPKDKESIIQRTLKQLDIPQPQIHVDIDIFELSTDRSDELDLITTALETGLELNQQTGNLSRLNPSTLFDTLKAMEKNGKASLLAKPSLDLLSNHPASIEIGEKIPYITTISNSNGSNTSLKHLNTGIHISIDANIIDSKNIHCSLEMDISLIKLFTVVENHDYPILSSRKIKTSLTLEPNKKSYLASFVDSFEKENRSSLPFLSKIPILKHLFSYTRSQKKMSTLLLFITANLEPEID